MTTRKLMVTVFALCVVIAGMGAVWQVNGVKTAQGSTETTSAAPVDTSAPAPQQSETAPINETNRSSGTTNTSESPRAREAEPAATGESPATTNDTRGGSAAPRDYDSDGMNDATDRCPTRPETVNGFQDSDGCPDVVKETGAS